MTVGPECRATLCVLALLVALTAGTPARGGPVSPQSGGDTANSDALVDIPDPALRGAVEQALGKAAGDPITRGEMETLQALGVSNVGRLTGIEHAINLSTLVCRDGSISDLTPLASLSSMASLHLPGNSIADVTPLAHLPLTELSLHDNQLVQLEPLGNLTSLTYLGLRQTGVSDLSALAGLTSLTNLDLAWNDEIADLAPVAGLSSLESLQLDYNAISDLTPLVSNQGLGSGDYVSVRGNPLGAEALEVHIPALRERGVWLVTDDQAEAVEVPDAALREALNEALGLGTSPTITRNDMARLTGLEAHGVSQLTGLEHAYRLEGLNVTHGSISDLRPLAGLGFLTHLYLAYNEISDVAPLAGLALLTYLDLGDNRVADAVPLAENEGLDEGDFVDLRRNPLGPLGYRGIAGLLRRDVDVHYNPPPELTDELVPDLRLREAIEQGGLFGVEFDNRGLRDSSIHLLNLPMLDASKRAIADLTGLDTAAGLEVLFLDGNRIADISPLVRTRKSWQALTLADNMVEDWAPLADLDRVRYLSLDGNSLGEVPPLPRVVRDLSLDDNAIADIAPLANRQIFRLRLNRNSITSLAPLARNLNLRSLQIDDNQVADLSPLDFYGLQALHLRNNAVRDISPLLQGEQLLTVDVRGNPLSGDALDVLDTLRERRVTVLAGESVPYFPTAGEEREGFVRMVNWGAEDGHVFIEAVDDAGRRAGPVRLDIGGRQAVHFNSTDLERGNAAKGLGRGIGTPAAGDWRLAVISALDVEVLSYIRTEDGFVTAMHDVVPEGMVPFFNPASNDRQRSSLRVVNTEADPGKWTTGGYDDSGKWHPMAGSLLVRPQHALALTAWALENAHGMGDGDGKWWLRARGFPWFAMSLLESPTGHLTNLSTAPANTVALAGGRTMHRLPLFPGGGGAREGFVRVINRSYSAGEVEIHAVDDAGARSGPVRLAVAARQAVHFNSTDLEAGNAAKGLAGRIGVGQGDWRLEIASELDLMALAYARTPDGFLTSLHDLAPVAADGSHRVVFFNPGSNTGQVSKLRVINDGRQRASVTVTGIDDGGSDSETVAFDVPAGSAVTFTSAELEAGGDGLAGRLGNGKGKWRLAVQAEEPIAVMSLLETPSGHLTNVSTGTGDPAWGVAEDELPAPPRLIAAIPEQSLANDGEARVDLSEHFSDEQPLTFSATSSDTGLVRVSIVGSVLTVTAAGGGEGRATVTVRVRDMDGHVVRQTFQVVVAVAPRFQDCPECPEMVVVPAGSFMMGAPEDEEGSYGWERPVHRVDIAAPFAIGVYEVTFAQWDACVAAGGCDGYEPYSDHHGEARANRPVQGLSWHDAQRYVAWLSAHTGETYRLPSEAEWEYAARAGTTTPFHFGETISTEQANYDGRLAYGEGSVGELRGESLPVGSFPANAWGLHDVHGNVPEWTQDCDDLWHLGYVDAPTDGSARETGDCDGRMLRGGYYFSEPVAVRSANRTSYIAERSNNFGLRVVRELGE